MLAFLYNFDVSKKRESLDERVSISFVMTFVEIVEIGNFLWCQIPNKHTEFPWFSQLIKEVKIVYDSL